jgi:hypothetical protein
MKKIKVLTSFLLVLLLMIVTPAQVLAAPSSAGINITMPEQEFISDAEVDGEGSISIPITIGEGRTKSTAVLLLDIVQGSSKKVKATATLIGGLAECINIKLHIYSGTSRSTCTKSVLSSTAFDIYGGQIWSIQTDAATKYFKVGATIEGVLQNSGTATKLFNKSGIPYPKYTDSRSGITVPEPSISWAKTTSGSWTSADRSNYLKWYERTYCSGKAQNWTGYEVHHMRPRAYGGTNATSNLLPLPTSVHSKFTGWFSAY